MFILCQGHFDTRNGTYIFIMQVIPKGHCSAKLATHTCCVDGTWYVSLDEKDIENTLGKEDSTTAYSYTYLYFLLFYLFSKYVIAEKFRIGIFLMSHFYK